jgi:hypothetical protein
MNMKAALYVLHYIHSTHDYGISFSSDDRALMHSYVHFPPSTNAEGYDDATPPTLGSLNTISLTVMLVGSPSLEAWLPMALFSLSSSFVA